MVYYWVYWLRFRVRSWCIFWEIPWDMSWGLCTHHLIPRHILRNIFLSFEVKTTNFENNIWYEYVMDIVLMSSFDYCYISLYFLFFQYNDHNYIVSNPLLFFSFSTILQTHAVLFIWASNSYIEKYLTGEPIFIQHLNHLKTSCCY